MRVGLRVKFEGKDSRSSTQESLEALEKAFEKSSYFLKVNHLHFCEGVKSFKILRRTKAGLVRAKETLFIQLLFSLIEKKIRKVYEKKCHENE